jgi:hypothetical protein
MGHTQQLTTGWMVQGQKPCVGARFSATFQTSPGAHPPSYKMGLFPWGKVVRVWFNHWPQSSTKLKERVQLYTYSPFVACCRVHFTFGYLLPWGIEGGKQSRHLETAYYYVDSIQTATWHVMNAQYSSNTVINYNQLSITILKQVLVFKYTYEITQGL